MRHSKKLKESAAPNHKTQRAIFDSYGIGISHRRLRYQLWLKFEGELVSNNRLRLHNPTSGKSEIVDQFVAHREFMVTRATTKCTGVFCELRIVGMARRFLPSDLSGFRISCHN